MLDTNWIQNPSDLTLLPLFWTPIPHENAIAITRNDGSPFSRETATRLINEKWDKIVQACATERVAKAYIYYLDSPGKIKTLEVPASFCTESTGRGDSTPTENVISVPQPAVDELFSLPEHEITEAMLCDSSRPTYVNRIFDQENLFANDAALEAQGRKPKFLGQTAYSLNDVDELERRCSYLTSGELLTEYSYQAWRWYFDTNAGRWRLKRMAFVSNFRRIDNCNLGRHLQVRNEPMWLGQVLCADELTQRIA
jgi:hypothetical protein